jgi:hypothetical protein
MSSSLPLSIQVIYRFSYALSLHRGAKKTCNDGDPRGPSCENALGKAKAGARSLTFGGK